MKAHVHETGGNAFTFRSLFLAVTLIALAFLATLGFNSISALAADKENVTDIKVPANETVLVSSKTVPINQEVTQDDYDKFSSQYNVSPNGPNTITSKTQEVESVETKTDTGKKSRTRTTTTYVFSGPAATPTPENTTNDQENPTSKLNPLIVAPVVAAVTVPAVAIPTALVTAVPAALIGALGGSALTAIPAALTGAALNAIPAALTGSAFTAIPASLAGAALNTIPAALIGAGLNAIPAALTGAGLNAIPAALTGAVLNILPVAIPAFLAGAALTVIPAAIGAVAFAAVPLLLTGAALAVIPAAIGGALLAAPVVALAALALPVIGFLAIAIPTVGFTAIALPIAGLIGLHILNTPLRLAFFTGLALLGLHILATPLRLAVEALLFGDLLLRLAGATAAFLNPFDLAINGFAFPVIALVRNFNFLVLAGLTALALTGLTLGAPVLGALLFGGLVLGGLTLGALAIGALTLGALGLGALLLGADFLLRLTGAAAGFLNPLDLAINGFFFPVIAILRNTVHILTNIALIAKVGLSLLFRPTTKVVQDFIAVVLTVIFTQTIGTLSVTVIDGGNVVFSETYKLLATPFIFIAIDILLDIAWFAINGIIDTALLLL